MADAASGVSAALDWSKWSFVNVDLGIHLARPPTGEWMATDAKTDIGPTGMGLCTSRLFDRDGAVGVSTQSLLVTPR
jgi:acyl-CoA thioesterase